jgi:hypothetical protein
MPAIHRALTRPGSSPAANLHSATILAKLNRVKDV